MSTLLITGAGFSTHFGHPLTRDLFRTMLTVYRQHPEADFEETDLRFSLDFLEEIERVTKTGQEIDIELMLARIWETLREEKAGKQFPPLDCPNKDYLRQGSDYGWPQEFGLDPCQLDLGGYPDSHFRNLTRLIAGTLWNTSAGDPGLYATKIHEEFPDVSGVITTNYDLLPELSIAPEQQIDYGIPRDRLEIVQRVAIERREVKHVSGSWSSMMIWRAPIETESDVSERTFPVYKIHGSMNLAFCIRCEKYLLWPGPWLHKNSTAQDEDLRVVGLNVANNSRAWHTICGRQPAQGDSTVLLMLIPPTRKKEDLPEWAPLTPVQKGAVELASKCESAVVIGSAVRPYDLQLLEVLEQLAGRDVVVIGGLDGFEALRQTGIKFRSLEHRRTRFFD